MYVPDGFNVTDQDDIEAFLERYDFATLVSAVNGGLTATHLPVDRLPVEYRRQPWPLWWALVCRWSGSRRSSSWGKTAAAGLAMFMRSYLKDG